MIRTGMFIQQRYEIIGKIGTGGMADVYKAKDHKLGRFVAVKVLKAEFSADTGFVSKFRAEAQSAAGLTHPNIVNVYDVGEEDNFYYIVMELVEGITLKNYIQKKGHLTIKEATSIAIQVCMGIEAAHKNNIIHRDIKPQNIIISREGKVKIADFGIAKAVSTHTNTMSSNVMGSVHYSSPEQTRGGYLDAKSDIYSLGIVIYEMVTGRVPFDGDTTIAIAVKHLQEEMVSPRAYVPDIPVSLEQIIVKCTQKSPDRRYASAGLLIQDLKQSLITPNVDFVRNAQLNDRAKTVVISRNELGQITGETGRMPVDSAERVRQAREAAEERRKAEARADARSGKRPEVLVDDEDDDEGEINPKLDKLMSIGSIVACIIIVAILLVIIAKLIGFGKGIPDGSASSDLSGISAEYSDSTSSDDDFETITMVSVMGEQIDTAAARLEAMGLVVSRVPLSTSGTVGEVVYQNPEAGVSVREGVMVELRYVQAADEVPIRVPSLAGKTEIEAENELKALDLIYNPSAFQYHDTIPSGQIISSMPQEGTEVSAGSIISVVVSKGPQEEATTTVPHVLNLSEAKAREDIEAAGLKVGTVDHNLSKEYGAGMVMEQSIEAGATVERGTVINIVISDGDEDPEEEEIWQCNSSIREPSNYQGGDVRITVTQIKDGETSTWTVVEGEPIDFETFRLQTEGMQGVSSGTVRVYEKGEDGEYQELGSGTVKFEPVSG